MLNEVHWGFFFLKNWILNKFWIIISFEEVFKIKKIDQV